MKKLSPRGQAIATILLIAVLIWPLIPGVPYDMLNTAILASRYCIIALSLVLLIGFVGQISLCQAALVGMGAFVSAIGVQRFGIHMPFTLLVGLVAGALTAAAIGMVALRVRGLYLAVATLIFAYVCDQYLFTQNWLVQSQSGTSIPVETIGTQGGMPFFDLADSHVFYYVALVSTFLALYGVANLRDSRLGRAFAAIRGSEVAAASLGINVTRYKLLGFACSGALAGFAGGLMLVGQRTVAPDQFNFIASLDFLAIAVVGGLRSLGGAVASALLFAVLVGEVFYCSPTLADYLDLISAGLLAVVLLFFRGGLGAVPERLSALGHRLQPALRRLRREPADAIGVNRERGSARPNRVGVVARKVIVPLATVGRDLAARLPKRRREAAPAQLSLSTDPSSPIDVVGLVRAARGPQKLASITPLRVETEVGDTDGEVNEDGPELRDLLAEDIGTAQVAGEPDGAGRREPVLLSADNITVRFGGLTAVNDASLKVCAGEIVGLIGPNGAGKTTMFNSILGLNTPTSGRVTLYGHDVATWDVHRRAALGVGRTFQILQLFPDLTVFDNLLVATHLQSTTGLWGSLAVTRRAKRVEAAAHQRVRAVLDLMDLGPVAHRRVAGLPFGVLRQIEVARTLVTGARLVCFDEPASGLDSAETERLIEWFRLLRQLGITLLVIEHDVDMVVRLCDYIYVLDQGRLLASGPPSQIQRDPSVIASYLGTSLEAAS